MKNTGGFHDRMAGYDQHGNKVFTDDAGHRRTYCRNCGIAIDVGGGCDNCKPLKTTDIHGVRNG